ncbi:TFIIB-type zinc ribbon-containing protein [Rhodalgimonas zhirmunskyi]|uniref:Zf-TFIIB domain-containing protein n=1 Tax=Rhodalgimonas zhirmunskyi TaxID=2964767 RepID=A0AAJ1X4G7_9RHOB|nr:zf-TFIIB domain-containing protein [Rhodoalgimonas zhirmunskyi]MDQ2093486.1 zf-TFIIB domain-containing protein [Rhodoalgimonas zhirmunskyi]
MKCPIDGETLVMSERHGVEIDYCPKCRGVWLDRGELDKIIDQAAGEMVLPDPDPAPQPVPPRGAPPRGAPYPTPEPHVYQEPYRREEPRYDEPSHNKGRRYSEDDDYRWRKRKKRKSILSEIFDFD